MLSCSTSGKIASYLVWQYSEHDVHVTFISNVQSTSGHIVQSTSMIRHIKRYTSKWRWDLTFREVVFLYIFWTVMTSNDDDGTSKLRPKTTKIRRRVFTFTRRSSIVFVGRTWIRRSCAQWKNVTHKSLRDQTLCIRHLLEHFAHKRKYNSASFYFWINWYAYSHN